MKTHSNMPDLDPYADDGEPSEETNPRTPFSVRLAETLACVGIGCAFVLYLLSQI